MHSKSIGFIRCIVSADVSCDLPGVVRPADMA